MRWFRLILARLRTTSVPTRAVLLRCDRLKIERHPLMLVEAEVKGVRIKTLLQNAETIKLVGKDGKPVPVTDLKENDEVMVYFDDTARHFGIKIEETIIEK